MFFPRWIRLQRHDSTTSFLLEAAGLDDDEAGDENAAAAGRGHGRSDAANGENDGLSLYYDDGFGGEGMDIEAF